LTPIGRDKQFVVRAPDESPHYIVPRALIDREWLALLKERDHLIEALPDQLAPLIAAERDPAKQKAILRRGIRGLLRNFDAAKKATLTTVVSTEQLRRNHCG
jgi:hypothetical protein